MKRLLLLALVVALVVGSVTGLSLDFQNPSDFTSYATCQITGSASCTWVQNATGRNSWLQVTSNTPGVAGSAYMINVDPLQTTYAAATYYGGSQSTGSASRIRLLDSGGAEMYMFQLDSGSGSVPQAGRYEINMVGGTAIITRDGTTIATSGALAQNPSYVTFGLFHSVDNGGYGRWDDFIYGSSENKVILGMPENGYVLRRDMITPAASGFYNSAGTLISSTNMTSTWGKASGTAETLTLEEWRTGTVVSTKSTGTSYAGSQVWEINNNILLNPSAPYGYYITTIPGSNEFSQVVPLVAWGANINFDSDTYSRGNTAGIYYSVDTGYWLPASYTYKMEVMDVYHNVVSSQSLSTSSGSKQYTFDDSDPLGVYYAWVIATPIGGGDDLWMKGDYTELQGYATYNGTVYDANTTLALSGATVNFTQGSTVVVKTTTADGNYTAAGFVTGVQVNMTFSKSGYRAFNYKFTPATGASRSINAALIPNTPLTSGRAIGGVAHESTYGSIVSTPYVSVKNATTAENYVTIGNIRGYYLCDNGASCSIIQNRLYDVWASKTGYSNSTTYPAVGP